MVDVSFAEANLLTLSRAALGLAPPQELFRLLAGSTPSPDTLAPPAMRLLEETLAKGTVLALARSGGWRPLGGKRLWERSAAPPLRFTPVLYQFLSWALRTPLLEAGPPPKAGRETFTPAEAVVVAGLLTQARTLDAHPRLAAHPWVRSSPLLALGYAAVLGEVVPLTPAPPLDASRDGPFLEGLADLFASEWVAAEERKGRLESPEVLARVGDAQEAALAALFGALGTVESRRLAGFVVTAASRWLATPRTAEHYGASLRADAPLSERQAARLKSGALVRAVRRLAAWDAEHRNVRFIDDGYDAAQALVKAWEPLSEAKVRSALVLEAGLTALPVGEQLERAKAASAR